MKMDPPKLNNVIEIDEARTREHLGELVRGSSEATLNARLDVVADQLCNVAHYERMAGQRDAQTGSRTHASCRP